jgi:hypothetical protein
MRASEPHTSINRLPAIIRIRPKAQTKIPCLFDRGGRIGNPTRRSHLLSTRVCGGTGRGGRPDLLADGQLTVAGQCRTLTGFAVGPSHPGVRHLDRYLLYGYCMRVCVKRQLFGGIWTKTKSYVFVIASAAISTSLWRLLRREKHPLRNDTLSQRPPHPL